MSENCLGITLKYDLKPRGRLKIDDSFVWMTDHAGLRSTLLSQERLGRKTGRGSCRLRRRCATDGDTLSDHDNVSSQSVPPTTVNAGRMANCTVPVVYITRDELTLREKRSPCMVMRRGNALICIHILFEDILDLVLDVLVFFLLRFQFETLENPANESQRKTRRRRRMASDEAFVAFFHPHYLETARSTQIITRRSSSVMLDDRVENRDQRPKSRTLQTSQNVLQHCNMTCDIETDAVFKFRKPDVEESPLESLRLYYDLLDNCPAL
ncbi:hypothetical protein F2P81_005297 [Scophthalmus maximus]|uniref:Uncharacterized protein n=1 Tax=Scophthalmus maximus TaxID=52904 RepID=A0A6A4T988_SCOMX|nr:hypothetical protein F2P81_005297 [Scophthalmus maximus]